MTPSPQFVEQARRFVDEVLSSLPIRTNVNDIAAALQSAHDAGKAVGHDEGVEKAAQIESALWDAANLGTGFVRFKPDGSAERLPPESVFLKLPETEKSAATPAVQPVERDTVE